MTSTDVQPGSPPSSGARRHLALPDSLKARWKPIRDSRAGQLLARLLDRYPELPPAPNKRWQRIGLAVTGVLALIFVIVFSAYLFALHDAYLTHAEDLGIMDQALWNTVHGAPLHQTICNIVTDTNCVGDVSRLAIHFEPIMFVISLLYLIAPSPKTLQFVQLLVVTCGAFPTYWIASRRLQSALLGVVFAAIYLLYPALQSAATFDFHAVTLSAAFLMFAFYFMLTRNNVGLYIACLLALSTKEEIPIAVALIGLSVAVLQRRWRVGFGIVALSVAWLIMALVIMHLASPLGHSPTSGRYAQLGSTPTQVATTILLHPVSVIHDYLLEPTHLNYVRSLLSPTTYLALLSPLTLLIAIPEMAINLLSTDRSMYSGLYQYNAAIVPVIMLATIESVALLSGLLVKLVGPATLALSRVVWLPAQAAAQQLKRLPMARFNSGLLLVITLVTVLFTLRAQGARGDSPLARGFTWPQTTVHAQLADQFIAMIPANASISSQSDLVPHLSQRRFVYLFPYHAEDADYVLLDVTGNIYPQQDKPQTYFQMAQQLLADGEHHVVAAENGYILIAHGAGPKLAPSDPNGLPASFYSFTTVQQTAVPHQVDVSFGSSLALVGYDVSPAPVVYLGNAALTVTTYWRVTAPLTTGTFTPELVLTRPDGSQSVIRDFATEQWLPMTTWQPGQTYALRIWPYIVTGRELGTIQLGMRIMQVSSGSSVSTPLPASSSTSGVSLVESNTLAQFTSERVAS